MSNYPTQRLTSLNVEFIERMLDEQHCLLASRDGNMDDVRKAIEDLRQLLSIYMPRTETARLH